VEVMLTIGEFSRMTYLSVKALRHYHDVGVLTPADIDPATGYRRYAASQVATAQAIRRFRDLEMPVDEVRAVLQARDVDERNVVILRHLQRMQDQLVRTQTSVASLQALLTHQPRPRPDIELRHLEPTPALVVRKTVEFEDCGEWLQRAYDELHAAITAKGLRAAGPDGAMYPDEFFEDGAGEVTAFVPTADSDRMDVSLLPDVMVAVLVHDGPFTDLDQTYGALGTAVAERQIADRGPIREHYLTPTTTEVCWPVAIGHALRPGGPP
jgi:DNA-binding transcriptional MerR regulator